MPRILALIVASVLSLPGPESTDRPPGGEAPLTDLAAAGLDPAPLVADALGLQMHLPTGAVVTTQVVQGRPTYLLSGTWGGAQWSMQAALLSPTLPVPSADGLIDKQLRAIQAAGRDYQVIANEPARHGEADGRLVYVRQTVQGGVPVVNGWLILPADGRTFLLLSVATTADDFTRLRPVLDASFATITLRSTQEVLRQRRAQLERSRAIIDTLTPQKLRSAVGEQQWFRIYRPGPSGRRADDTEVGFLSLHCTEAMRGELTPERSPDSFGVMEAQKGLMVRVEARAILNAATHQYLDVQGRYWMAWDRTQEAWSLRQTQRQGDATRTTAETGVRSFAILSVIQSSKEQLTREPAEWTIPDKAYLSQPEIFLIGRLLPRDGSVTGDMVFHYYDNRRQRLSQRVDRWQPAEDGSENWILTTKPALEVGTITQIFDSAGNRLKRTDTGGNVTQRIDPSELQRLWQAKGLLAR